MLKYEKNVANDLWKAKSDQGKVEFSVWPAGIGLVGRYGCMNINCYASLLCVIHSKQNHPKIVNKIY